MSKKLHLIMVALLITASMFAQTIVSTTPENKKVILEEFTGIYCVFCPDGHAIANAIKNNNPDDFFIINIHNSGSFSNPTGNDPDFQTPDGGMFRSFFGANSFPSGMINRHTFSGASPVISRGAWTSSTNQQLALSSYVNVAVEADIDAQTNVLTVHVESFYTASSPEASNFLTVALLQNNTFGPQTGGGLGDLYPHQHRLVDIITPTFGEEITVTTSGTFIDRTYTYTVPTIYNNVPVEISDLEIVAFMAESEEEIISGNGAQATYSNLAFANDANLKAVNDIDDQFLCNDGTVSPSVTLRNEGGDPITSLEIQYSVNGGTVQSFTYTGSITTFQEEEITLDEIAFTAQATNTLNVTLANDENNANNTGDTTFSNVQVDTAGNLSLEIRTDENGDEVFYNIKDSNNTIVMEGGPFDDNSTNLIDVVLTEGCYTFTIIDTAGDGGRRIRLYDPNGVVAFLSFGQYGFGEEKSFTTDGILGTEDLNTTQVTLFPNPASTVLNITNADKSTVEVYNILGQIMMTKSNISMNEELNVSQLVTGTYFVKISNGTTTTTKKFIIAR